jgi:outer membrane receptor for ferrienterochelin and colicins
MKKILPVLFLLLSSGIFAQSSGGQLTGQVKDGDTRLPYASVRLLRTSYETTTDSTGYYRIGGIPTGTYWLEVRYLGYEITEIKVTISAGSTVHQDVNLKRTDYTRDQVVVTGSVQEQKKSESVSSIDVYNAEYFKKNNVTNVFDALSSINGIYTDIDQDLTYVTDVNINGLEGNYTMFLIDGVPAMNGLAGLYSLTAFPMAIVDRIEVEKGPSSTLYGSDALAGVINIITKDPGDAPRFYADAMINSLLDANVDLSGAFKVGKATSIIAFSGESSDYRRDINHDGFMDYPLVNRANFYNKWSIARKDKKKTILYGRYLFEDRFAGQMDAPGRIVNSDLYYTEWISTHQWQAGFLYELPTREHFVLSVDYSEHYQQAYYDTNYFHGNQKTGFAQLSWDKKIHQHKLLAGATYRAKYYIDNTGLSNESITGLNNLVQIAGVFLQDEVTITPQNKLLFGCRFDYSTRSGPIATPRIDYKWNSDNQKNIFRIGFSTAYRVPNLLDEGFGALNGSRQVEVDGPLRTEYAIGMTTSYTRLQRFNKGAISIEVGAFGTWLTNFVNPDYDTDSTKIIYRNSNGGGTVGANFKTDIVFNFPLKMGIAATYAYTVEIDKEDSGDVTIEIPTHSPPLTMQWYVGYTFPQAGVTIDYTANLVSPMLLATVDNDFRPSQSPWFSLENIQVTKKFKNRIEIFGGVKNFLNFKEQNPILRPFDPFNREVNVNNPNGYRFDTTYGYAPLEGIKGFIGIRYTLK